MNETFEITHSDDDMQDLLMREYVGLLVEVTNAFVVKLHMEPEVAADCLLSGTVEILRKRHGAAVAAEKLQDAAEVVLERHPLH